MAMHAQVDRRVARGVVVAAVAVVALAMLAAWAARPEPLFQWEYGELRSATGVVDVRFMRASEVECLTPPRELRGSVERTKLYFLDWLAGVGWELVDVSQTDRDWVYLMRRARSGKP